MEQILLQVAQTPNGGVNLDQSVLLGIISSIVTALAAAIGVLWRQSVAEGRRKDELIDKLLSQIGRTADVTDRTVALAETRERTTRR